MRKYSGKVQRFAHTGVTQCAPENTLEAFKAAVEMGCEGIEIDVNLSKDGEIIVTHNSNLEYMTFEENCVVLKEMTAEEIKKVDIPFKNAFRAENPPIPWTEQEGGKRVECAADCDESRVTHLLTFEEFDAWFSTVKAEMTVEIELKDRGMLTRLDEIFASSKNVSRYIVFSGRWDVIFEIQEHYAEVGKPDGLRLGANIRFLNDDTLEFLEEADIYEVGLNNEAFTKEDVDTLAQNGIKVFSNLGDYEEWWAQLEPLGVTAFKTNYPEAYTRWWENK